MVAESVILYQTTDVCSSTSFTVKKGDYVMGDSMWQPALARIEPLTSFTVFYNNKESKVYNNPYTDRYVVVRLTFDPSSKSQNISRISVSPFQRDIDPRLLSGENIDCNCSSFMSPTDIIIILIIFYLLILVVWK
jgi:hypothetical protein